ncbi:hypothetical protein DFP72DRAFT_1047512 [Ephemerocybe angulata]|uniref:Uncharacterized protein n=1 Tax=Ephemerocybe angulata TaxID=980116 RepID=A0A8H6HSC7_9AGAR|nr:hypothetical protein DFP72DRAFT_1047512 [Tulosesus angulatus]
MKGSIELALLQPRIVQELEKNCQGGIRRRICLSSVIALSDRQPDVDHGKCCLAEVHGVDCVVKSDEDEDVGYICFEVSRPARGQRQKVETSEANRNVMGGNRDTIRNGPKSANRHRGRNAPIRTQNLYDNASSEYVGGVLFRASGGGLKCRAKLAPRLGLNWRCRTLPTTPAPSNVEDEGRKVHRGRKSVKLLSPRLSKRSLSTLTSGESVTEIVFAGAQLIDVLTAVHNPRERARGIRVRTEAKRIVENRIVDVLGGKDHIVHQRVISVRGDRLTCREPSFCQAK